MNSIENIVNQIDTLIRKNLWFDFSVLKYDGSNLVIAGGIDLHFQASHSLEIVFEQVFYYSGFFLEWHSDTKNPVLILPNNAKQLNLKHQIEQGYIIFSFVTEDYENNVIVAAKNISYNVL
jgi:hypothetical protein